MNGGQSKQTLEADPESTKQLSERRRGCGEGRRRVQCRLTINSCAKRGACVVCGGEWCGRGALLLHRESSEELHEYLHADIFREHGRFCSLVVLHGRLRDTGIQLGHEEATLRSFLHALANT